MLFLCAADPGFFEQRPCKVQIGEAGREDDSTANSGSGFNQELAAKSIGSAGILKAPAT
jgi:hypothetical protein